jgi:hypothetical protein
MDRTTKYVVGLFETRDAAQRAVNELSARGFTRERVSVAMRDRDEAARLADTTGTETTEAAGTGAVGGGILGGLAGLLVGLGALTVPGVGPVLAAGPLAAALGTTLAGAGIGAAAGGLVGALVGMGVPEEEAEYYTEGVRRGGVLVSVHTSDAMADAATDVMRAAGALDVETERGRGAWGTLGAAEPAGVPIVREEVPSRPPGPPEPSDRPTFEPATPSTPAWEDAMPYFQQHSATFGSRWADDEPAYRYGFERWTEGRWSGRRWDEVEPELRRDWEARYPDRPWDVASNPIKHAWDHMSATPHTHAS